MVELNKNIIRLIAGGFVLLAGGAILVHKSLVKKNLQFTIVERELTTEKGVKLNVEILNIGKKDIKNLVYHVVINGATSQKFSVNQIKSRQKNTSIIYLGAVSEGSTVDNNVKFVIDKINT